MLYHVTHQHIVGAQYLGQRLRFAFDILRLGRARTVKVARPASPGNLGLLDMMRQGLRLALGELLQLSLALLLVTGLQLVIGARGFLDLFRLFHLVPLPLQLQPCYQVVAFVPARGVASAGRS